MFKKKCCENPDIEVLDRFYTYKEDNMNSYPYVFNSRNITTTISIPSSIIDEIVKASKDATFEEIKQVISEKLTLELEHANKVKKSVVEITKCKNCGKIKKTEVKI